MSLFSLAFQNIKRNFKKYVMHFFSLSFSVFTAYSFLALMQNGQVRLAFTYDARYRAMLLSFGIVIMVFVIFYLLSSNNSFIKARKKEISMYALLGMENRRIGQLIFTETMVVGLTALLAGIGAGIFFSKLIAMLLLDISLSAFTGKISFSLDIRAVYITFGLFMSIFFFLALSGFIVINRFELVDLFKADKVSEKTSEGSILKLVLSIILIGGGYFLATWGNSELVIFSLIPILILVISGTYLFFGGGLSKVLSLTKKNKPVYYRGVNLISTTAFSHRIKSIGFLMATIAVLSAVATTAIATGFTLYTHIEKNTFEIVGYDLAYYGGKEGVPEKVSAAFEEQDVKIIESFETERYATQPEMENIILEDGRLLYEKDAGDYFMAYSQSTYNELVDLSKGELKSLSIKAEEAVYLTPYYFSDGIVDRIVGQSIYFSATPVTISSAVETGITSFGARNSLVLNDDLFAMLVKSGEIRNVLTNEGEK